MPIGNIFKLVKSSDKLVDMTTNLVKGASKGIDQLALTNEERIEFNMKIAEGVSSFVQSTLSENTVRSKTRRYIALIFVIFFVVLLLTAAIFYQFNKEYAEFLLNLAQEQKNIVLTIVAFYFGYYATMRVLEQRKSRKERKAENQN